VTRHEEHRREGYGAEGKEEERWWENTREREREGREGEGGKIVEIKVKGRKRETERET
jgi:hypothetical protein